MSSVLERMIHRSRGPLSAAQPLIPPVYAPVPLAGDDGGQPSRPLPGSDLPWAGVPRAVPRADAPPADAPAAHSTRASWGDRLAPAAPRATDAAPVAPARLARSTGRTWAAEVIGPTGPAGATGPAGPAGTSGPAGTTGLDGATGPEGPARPLGADAAGPAEGRGPGAILELPASWVADPGPAAHRPGLPPAGRRAELPSPEAAADPALTNTIGHSEVRAAPEARPRPERARPDPPPRQPFRPQVTLAEFLGRTGPGQAQRRGR